jgi:hypothetical protein
MCATFCFISLVIRNILKSMHLWRALKIDVPAIAAITTIRAAFGFVFLPFVSMAAIATITGFNVDHCFINKHF